MNYRKDIDNIITNLQQFAYYMPSNYGIDYKDGVDDGVKYAIELLEGLKTQMFQDEMTKDDERMIDMLKQER